MNNWTDSTSSNNYPYEKRDTCCWRNKRLHCEEMSNLVDREPDERQRSEPEEDK